LIVICTFWYCIHKTNGKKMHYFILTLSLFNLIFSNSQNEPCILLSYPRSGNTFTRYCIEYLTQRPTADIYEPSPMSHPLSNQVNLSKPFVYKYHHINNPAISTPIILLIRNPKEVAYSHGKSLSSLLDAKKSYVANIKMFDQYNGEKLLIYYEDLITQTRNELRKIQLFLSDDKNAENTLTLFMEKITYHKAQCSALYRDAVTKDGNSKGQLIYYSKDIDRKTLLDFDTKFKKRFPKIWEKYLKRYEEKIM
jgi:hypothetical protein